MAFASSEQQTDKFYLKKLVAGALMAGTIILPLHWVIAEPILDRVATKITTNDTDQVKYSWEVTSNGFNDWVDDLVNTYAILTDLEGRGVYGFVNENNNLWNWYGGTEINYFENGTGSPIYPGGTHKFTALIDKDQIIGNEEVMSYATAPSGDSALFPILTPLTRSTTTTNGAPLGALVDSGLATNGSSRSTFEAASQINSDADFLLDWQEWLIGGDTNTVDSFDGGITSSNGNTVVSWSPAISNRIYNIWTTTNLAESSWVIVGSITNVSSYADTNNHPAASYKIEVSLP